MNKVWIFGDSYVDRNWHTNCKDYSWVTELEKNYDVENYAVMGSGPEYSFSKLYQTIKNNNKSLKNICVIFISSDLHRLNLNFWHTPQDQVYLKSLLDKNIDKKNLKYIAKKLFVKDLFRFYLTEDWQSNRELHNFATINYFSNYFKKILYWTTEPKLKTNDFFYQHKSNNLCCPDQGLNELSYIDLGYQPSTVFLDNRRNHFSKINHKILYNQIVNWIEHDYPIDTSKIVSTS